MMKTIPDNDPKFGFITYKYTPRYIGISTFQL